MLRDAARQGLLIDVGALMYTADPGPLEVPPGIGVLAKPLGIKTLLAAAKAAAPRNRWRARSRMDDLCPPSSQRL